MAALPPGATPAGPLIVTDVALCALSVHEIGYISTSAALLRYVMVQPDGHGTPDLYDVGAEGPELSVCLSGRWRKIAGGPLEET